MSLEKEEYLIEVSKLVLMLSGAALFTFLSANSIINFTQKISKITEYKTCEIQEMYEREYCSYKDFI